MVIISKYDYVAITEASFRQFYYENLVEFH